MKVFIESNPSINQSPRFQYVVDFINNHPLTPKDCIIHLDPNIPTDLRVGYGIGSDETTRFIPFHNLFNLQNASDLISNVHIWKDRKIYGLSEQSLSSPFFVENKYGFDFFGTIFFHVSRFEEILCQESQLDDIGIMKSEEQFLVKNKIETIPIIDHIIWAWWSSILNQSISHPTEYILTHDIDAILKYPSFYKFLRACARNIVYDKSLLLLVKTGMQYLQVLFGKKDPFDTFNWLLMAKKEIQKEIYFLVGGEVKHIENFYKVTDELAKKTISLARDRGYVFGIHPSFNSYADHQIWSKEKKELENALSEHVKISRQHFLRFNIQKTGIIIDKEKIEMDSSLGFRDRIGFRCGTGFPYHLYNFEKEKPFQFLERPLVVMDSALLKLTNYNTDLFHLILQQFLEDNLFDTHITFNFHNSTFADTRINGERLKQIYLDTFVQLIN